MSAVVPTSSVVSKEVINAYLDSRLNIVRDVKIFEADGKTPWVFDGLQQRLVSGDVSVDATRDERRTVSLVLANFDGALKHNPDGGFWYDKIIKTYRGLVYFKNGVKKKFLCQTGEFMIDSINTTRLPHHVTVSGRDYTKRLLLDDFFADTAFSAGDNVDDIVKTVATNGGIKKFRLGSGGVQVGSAPTFARGSSRWENIKSLCEGLNIEVYFDREGYLVTRPYDDVSVTPPSLTLSMSQGKENVVDYAKDSSDSNIFNHIVVTGTSEEETVTGYKFIKQVEDLDPDSPTYTKKIGRRTFNFEVSYLTSQDQCNDLARRLLQVKRLEDFTLTFSSVCLPWLEANRILEFKDPNENFSVPTRFLFTDFTIPMELGPMSGSGKRIVIVGSNNDSPVDPSEGSS